MNQGSGHCEKERILQHGPGTNKLSATSEKYWKPHKAYYSGNKYHIYIIGLKCPTPTMQVESWNTSCKQHH
jgi:hypothetical protein